MNLTMVGVNESGLQHLHDLSSLAVQPDARLAGDGFVGGPVPQKRRQLHGTRSVLRAVIDNPVVAHRSHGTSRQAFPSSPVRAREYARGGKVFAEVQGGAAMLLAAPNPIERERQQFPDLRVHAEWHSMDMRYVAHVESPAKTSVA